MQSHRDFEEDGSLDARDARIERQPWRQVRCIVLGACPNGAVEREATRNQPVRVVAHHDALVDPIFEFQNVFGCPQGRTTLEPPGLAEDETAEARRVQRFVWDQEGVCHR